MNRTSEKILRRKNQGELKEILTAYEKELKRAVQARRGIIQISDAETLDKEIGDLKTQIGVIKKYIG